MPTPKVVATLPFSAAATRTTSARSSAPAAFDPAAPATIALHRATQEPDAQAPLDDAYRTLLDEASTLARRFGCELRRRCLGGVGGGYRWVGGRLRVVLDIESTPERRLEVLADALRGEPRLPEIAMSRELAAYLQPRRAA